MIGMRVRSVCKLQEVWHMAAVPSALIIADGGVDLPEGAAEQLGIRLVPLRVLFGSQELISGVDITPADFYRRLRERGEFPSTSQPSAGDYLKVYTDAAQVGLPIISLHISGGLSGSIASARAAREMLPDVDIHIVDTLTLSGAMAMQVLVAAHAAREGKSPEEIIALATAVGHKTDMLYTIDKLDYLRRGGRIGRVAGYMGSLLGVRPIITVDKASGTYVPTGRARSWRGAISQLIDTMVERLGEGASVSLMVLRGDCQADADWLLSVVKGRLSIVWLEIVWVNPTLGAHVGPDAIGVAFYPGLLPIPALSLA